LGKGRIVPPGGRVKLGKTMVGAATALLAAAAGVYAIVAATGRAEVQGLSGEERVASVCRIIDRRPPGSADALARAAASDADPRVREAALVGLAPMARPRHRQVIEERTHDPAAPVRAAAAAALGTYGDEAAADRCGEMAVGDPNACAQVGAVTGLGRNGCPRATMHLLEALESAQTSQAQFLAARELYKKLGMRYIGKPPGAYEPAAWKTQVAFLAEWVKNFPQVQAAYQAAGRALVRHPENRTITKCQTQPNRPE